MPFANSLYLTHVIISTHILWEETKNSCFAVFLVQYDFITLAICVQR